MIKGDKVKEKEILLNMICEASQEKERIRSVISQMKFKPSNNSEAPPARFSA